MIGLSKECSKCGNSVSSDELTEVDGLRFCQECIAEASQEDEVETTIQETPTENSGHGTFQIEEVLKSAFEIFKEHWLFAMGVVFIPGMINMGFSMVVQVINIATQLIASSAGGDSAQVIGILGIGVGLIVNIISSIISIWLTGNSLLLCIRLTRGDKGKLTDLFQFGSWTFGLIGLNILIGIAVVFGFLFLIIPGVLVLLYFSQAINVYMDKKNGVINALKESIEIMDGNKLNFILLIFITALIGIFGTLLTCGLGFLILSPWSYLVIGTTYNRIRKID